MLTLFFIFSIVTDRQMPGKVQLDMKWKETRQKILDIWYQMAFRNKLYVIIACVGIVMAFSTFVHLKVTVYFVNNSRTIMDDNFACFRFQEALANESRLFKLYIGDKTLENEWNYKNACIETKRNLSTLPYDYQNIGKNRYAVTWSIHSSYEQYEKNREKVVGMETDEPSYVKTLYETYRMQQHIDSYINRLTKTVLTEGNDYYDSQILRLRKLPVILLVISVAAFAMLLLVLRFITGRMVKVLGQLSLISGKIEENDFTSSDVIWEGKDEIGQLVSAFNKMKRATGAYVFAIEEKRQIEEMLHQEEIERSRLEQRFSMAQLQLIKSQLNPHFLFNTLNMITRTAQMEEAPMTEEMLVVMSNLLRYSLRTKESFAPLDQELKIVEDYMYIQKMRFGSRICWRIECREELSSMEVPVFLLQPLVENAVIHGISEKEEGGTICIRILKKEEGFWISVADTGKGIDTENLERIRREIETKGTGLGIGLGNIYRRIAAYYEDGAVSIHSREGHGTVIQITCGERKG